ncbi:nrps [Neopestalotiopsis sp. 37M]|nr:nrps [Neopestalotiopsis sp. 37M]
MVFYPPTWLPAIPQDLSALGTVGDFVLHGESESAFNQSATDSSVLVSALDPNKSRTSQQLADDVETLAAALARELKWSPNELAQDGKVIAILSENSVEYLTCCWAIHRIGATCLLLHGSTSAQENAKHLKDSNCSVLITSPLLLQSGQAAMAAAGVSDAQIYLNGATGVDGQLKTVEELLASGSSLDRLPALNWGSEEVRNTIAYLCPTSGTSGIQKLARSTHASIIANILQLVALERISRKGVEVVLGVLPLSHVQGIVSSHSSIYVRDRFIVHTKFDMQAALASIQAHRITRLYLVPSVLAALVGNPFLFKAFDLSSIKNIYVGAGSVTSELHAKVKAVKRNWTLVSGYGLTESPAAVAMSSPHEYIPGTVGILLSGYQARLLREDGTEVESFDEAGELLLQSPNQASGYLGDDEGTWVTFHNRWLRTGDVAMFRRSPSGDAHLSIVDRLRDMIKVKGLQVSPVAIEECLRQHPGVADVAVIGVPDELAGERPKAFIVLPQSPQQDKVEAFFDGLDDFVEGKLTEPHWLRGKYEVVDALPRNPSGKVAKGLLRARGQ